MAAKRIARQPQVFVYGTLKSGHRNNELLARTAEAKLLGRCEIRGKYRLYTLGPFPGLVCSSTFEDTRKVIGEVWSIPQHLLVYLDILEGHPVFYMREKIPTPFGPSWVYMLPLDYIQKSDWIKELSPDQEEWGTTHVAKTST